MTDDVTRDFAATFKRFLDGVVASVPEATSFFSGVLAEHFGEDPKALSVVVGKVPAYEHADLQAAVDAYITAEGRSFKLDGITSAQVYEVERVSLPGLLINSNYKRGPVEYAHVSVGSDDSVACVQRGLFLVCDQDRRLALFVCRRSEWKEEISVEVMGKSNEEAKSILAELRVTMRAKSVHRGKILSLDATRSGDLVVNHRRLPTISAEQLVLPVGLRERIERNTIRFAERSQVLAAAGRHIKRGLLLHGPSGTGKTLTAMYLATQMPNRTVLLLSGRGLGLLEASCSMARVLQPSTVIIEDVDLVAEERTRANACQMPLLFELLNQMDGIGEDADVLFLLTTNRPDILEPALAARPGRIDQAIEIPLPDAECRKRLIELYSRGLTLRVDSIADIVERTNGASAAFMRELLRRATLIATDESNKAIVELRHIDEAMGELVIAGGTLTRSLLGAPGVGASAEPS